mmetsp:Transcript_47649/g.53313  ORF Transcript_47649/g.53313 Transcript_47649/m.53313 type:complete len:240 (-) Transcript_47649:72-791(-)
MANERTALINTNQYLHHHVDDDDDDNASNTSSLSPTSVVVDFFDDDKKKNTLSSELKQKQHATQRHRRESSQSHHNHITEHVPFYLLYFLLVYLFLFLIQLGMLVVTVDTKWFRHRDEPTWIFPVDVMVVSMLTIEVAAHFIVSTQLTKQRGCIMTSIRPQLLIDFAIALLSIQMIILDVMTTENVDKNDKNQSHASWVGLLRDTLRIVRISEFVYILQRVLGDPDWHTNDSLSMNDVL